MVEIKDEILHRRAGLRQTLACCGVEGTCGRKEEVLDGVGWQGTTVTFYSFRGQAPPLFLPFFHQTLHLLPPLPHFPTLILTLTRAFAYQ